MGVVRERGGPIDELIGEDGFDRVEVEAEVVVETHFFIEPGKGRGGGGECFFCGRDFGAQLAKVGDGDFFVHEAFLRKDFEFVKLFGSVGVVEREGLRQFEGLRGERFEELAGATTVGGVVVSEGLSGGGLVEGAQRFCAVIQSIEKAGSSLSGVGVFEKISECLLVEEREIAGDDEPSGIGVFGEGRLDATERTRIGCEVGDGWVVVALIAVSHGEKKLRDVGGDGGEGAFEESLAVKDEGRFISAHATGFSANEKKGFEWKG